MGSVITVEGLGKSYSISHRHDDGYATLRDRLSRSFTCAHTAPASENFWALRDINFEIAQGEKVGVVGRNGAGKSTLLKILSRITPPTHGRVTLHGRVASLLEVGTGFHPELTGRENIFLNGSILGMRRQEVRKRFDQIVEFAEIDRFLDTPVKRYSSGMYTRLAFAVAAHLDSDILLLDEVLAVGDALFQKKCLSRIDDLKSAGRTVLLVSHNMASIQAVCDRAILLENGRLEMDAPVEKTIERYLKGVSLASSNSLPVEHMPRADDLGKDVRIIDCDLLNAEGESTNKLLFGEAFSIKLKIRGARSLPHATLLVEIDTVRSTECLTTLAVDYDELAEEPSKDELEIAVTVSDLTLGPGLYSIVPGIRRGRVALDQVRGAVVFEVLPLSKTGECPATSFWGLIQVNGSWRVMETPEG